MGIRCIAVQGPIEVEVFVPAGKAQNQGPLKTATKSAKSSGSMLPLLWKSKILQQDATRVAALLSKQV